MYDVIVIGGGPAGVTAALRARELGATVALVERGRMGGTCTNDGCLPTRVLAKAARLWRDAFQFNDYGIVISPPELDYESLMRRVQHLVYSIHEKKQLIGHLQATGVVSFVGVGPARFIDANTIEIQDGSRLQADKFILCAGGRARRLDFPGEQFALTHSDIWSLKNLPKSLLVVGGAATGCQLASIFNAFGVDVTVFDVAPNLVRVEDQSIAKALENSFRMNGIKMVLGINGINRIDRHADGVDLSINVGSETVVYKAQAIVMSTGWLGNLDGLNLQVAGVETKNNYVLVNDFQQTTADHIFAAGDITGRMMLVQSAGFEARSAAENAVLGLVNSSEHQIVPHGGFTDPEYGSVGLTEDRARLQFDVVVSTVPYTEIDRAVIDSRTEGFCKLIVSKDTHRILGAHVVGEQALEIVHVVAAGIASDIRVEQLAELEIAYPTYTAIVGLAARAIIRELGEMPLSLQWRTLGRPSAAEWERRD